MHKPFDGTPKLGNYASAKERNASILEMYQNGRASMQEIADTIGVSRQRVHQICQRAGVRSGGKRIAQDDVRAALRSSSVHTLAGLARAIGNRSVGGLREMLKRHDMYDGIVRLFRFRKAVIAKQRYDGIVQEYKRLSAEAGNRPLTIDELRASRLNAFRLNKVFGKNYISKLRVACGEAARKPRARNHEKDAVEVAEPTPQEAGV